MQSLPTHSLKRSSSTMHTSRTSAFPDLPAEGTGREHCKFAHFPGVPALRRRNMAAGQMALEAQENQGHLRSLCLTLLEWLHGLR
jgi:hypothetical protein